MILTRLREETAPLHTQVEQSVDIPGRLVSIASYAAILGRFLGFHAPLEAQLGEVEGFDEIGLNLKGRRKAGWLRQDLAACGVSAVNIASLPMCTDLPDTRDLASALGCLYVLEGSTLGGNFIRKEVKRALGLEPGSGCSFFSSYQGELGAMWNGFCVVLDRYASEYPEAADSIVSAASETFGKFEAWVVEERRS